MASLTIAIPTYDRPRQLEATLHRLKNQITAECQLVILDNASPMHAKDILASVSPNLIREGTKVIRNPTNLGAGANIMRAFENCETAWLWILGDDDEPLPNAVQTALAACRRATDAVFVHFDPAPAGIAVETRTKGLDAFLRETRDFSRVLFLSSGIYSAPKTLHFIRFGYSFILSLAPHMAVLLTALHTLADSGVTLITNDQIVAPRCLPPAQERYNIFDLYLGLHLLLELPLTESERRMLNAKLGTMRPSPLNILANALSVAEHERNWASARFFYDKACERNYYYRRPWLRALQVPFLRALLMFPECSSRLACAVLGIYGGKERWKIADSPRFHRW